MRRALPLLLLAACGTSGVIAKPPQRDPEVDRKYKEAAERGDLRFGMNRGEVRIAMRGEPQRTRKTVFQRRPATLWSYPYIDIYFDDEGYVIGWQRVTG